MSKYLPDDSAGDVLPQSDRLQILSPEEYAPETGSGLAFCIFLILVSITVMARPLRIEFSGALYHVTSRGDKYEGDR
jgi:hypothetical protein